MRNKILVFFCFIVFCSFGQGARAQLPVTDASVDADLIQIQTDTLVPMLTGIETTATDMTELTVPTVVTGATAGLDGGADADVASQTAEFLPMLNGTTSVSATAKSIEAQEEADLAADEAQGIVTGNYADQQAERDRLIGTNLQGQAYGEWNVYGDRFAAANTMLATLSAQQNLKQVATYSAAIMVEMMKTLDLIGQTMALVAVASAMQQNAQAARYLGYENDHNQAAIAIAVP